MAVNCWVKPAATLAGEGVTAIDFKVTLEVTWRLAAPFTLPEMADMISAVEVTALPVARPAVFPVEEIVALVVSDELQATNFVRSFVELSL